MVKLVRIKYLFKVMSKSEKLASGYETWVGFSILIQVFCGFTDSLLSHLFFIGFAWKCEQEFEENNSKMTQNGQAICNPFFFSFSFQ